MLTLFNYKDTLVAVTTNDLHDAGVRFIAECEELSNSTIKIDIEEDGEVSMTFVHENGSYTVTPTIYEDSLLIL